MDKDERVKEVVVSMFREGHPQKESALYVQQVMSPALPCTSCQRGPLSLRGNPVASYQVPKLWGGLSALTPSNSNEPHKNGFRNLGRSLTLKIHIIDTLPPLWHADL